MGGIPGLANQFRKEDIFKRVYSEVPSVVNDSGTRPKESFAVPEGTVTLPEFYESVKSLDQEIYVDYYLPGCPPPVKLIVDAVMAIVEGKLPEKGTVLAPDVALCDECKHKEDKPDEIKIKEFKRPHQVIVEPDKCLLDQGLLCLGPVTRSGCEAACINANMPCSGCMGPTSRVRDFGAKALSLMASVLDIDTEEEASKALENIVDPTGTFYRYSMPYSVLHGKCKFESNGGTS